ncbi:type 4a pilus biogenesis protein PilY1 [Marinobacter nanhaiticus D15-8W]|uniref:PilY1 beta-propeller domain-containing protein n=1 Tax=Marinobacter nanhaiticus D15-8W TaxID=626887 RepID=N6WNN9_9GAMM|nr:PilC/PilY family type IV pilus protein [Marinobacter nanhaiticus]ENO12647.1 hypothetical protein J057_14635 [Marinobacter nanhaiticus D15-8W]BES69985.1 type 4a pilus biogenesis protein PilY1 [Marinobacter nanhaiticus D15-8W]
MKYSNAKLNDPISEDNGFFAPASTGWWSMSANWCLVILTLFALLPVLSVQAAVDDVDVDQSPLIVSDPLPPNIVLLHDDSGSMGYDYLPDTAPKNGDDFRKSNKNRQYYNPQTLYTIPPKADGTLYPTPSFPDGYEDPFNGTRTDNILSESDYSDSWYNGWMRAFVYFDGNERHHVIEDGGNCSYLSNCHYASDSLVVGGTTTTYGQNVANFYSYYRARYLSAKSGIMSAFSELNPNYRFGFGSINGSNNDKLGSGQFSTSYMKIKQVEPFGNGSNGTQKKLFWEWLNGVGTNGGTPLRRALETAGRYYQTQQPWLDTDDQGREVEYSCRPSYTILVSDGYWSGNNPSNFLKKSDNTSTDNYKAVPPFIGGAADGDSATLADVANYYWKTDLRDGASEGQQNNVPATENDPATWQHMTTFTVGLGLTVDGLGATQTELFNWARLGDDAKVTGWGGWPTPGSGGGSGKSENVSDMLHAAINGHGNFFSARDPSQFAQGLRDALADIAAAPGAGSTPSFSGGETLTSATRQYTASYMTGSWTGDLKSVAYNDTTKEFTVDPWSASAQLPAAADRNIWTTDKSGMAVEFKEGELSDYWETLGNNLYLSEQKGEAWGKHLVNYLRGDQRYEKLALTPLSDVLRERDSLLGDIVNSTPVVIGAPKADLYKHVLNENYFDGLSGENTYDDFVADNATRTSIVYVAANDGMLHAFNAEDGNEVFAFIPGAVVGGTGDASLARLANPEYGVYDPVDGTQPVPHQYYNDGRLTTQNVFIDGEWKTILVGTTGRGTSRTVYALDITNPADLADPDKAEDAILWERSAGDGKSNDDWIGMALGRATISLIKGSSGDEGQWVAHLGNGPNSEKNQAALLQFDLATGELVVYPTGTMSDNGLAAPYVIQADDSDGLSEYAFAGDLQGNVWRIELSATGGSVSDPIYVAKDDAGNRQPITADMLATQNEKTGAVWVFFGTGRFLTGADITSSNPQIQTWYGLRALKGASGLAEVTASHSRNNLQEREILAENADGYRATSTGDFSDLTSDNNVGWYMDLESPVKGREGERIVYQTQLIAGRLIVNTLIPKSSSPCDTFPGGATLIVDPFSGANPGEGVLDSNGDGKIDNSDSGVIDGEVHHYNGQRYDVGLAGSVSALIGEGGEVKLFGLRLNATGMGLGTSMGATGAQRLNWHEIFN